MFRKTKGATQVTLSTNEAEVLRRIIAEYQELLESGNPRTDQVMGRLFPPASKADEKVSNEFWELTYDELRKEKRKNSEVVIESLGEAGDCKRRLEVEEAEAWLTVLADLRLAVGTRIGVDEQMMEADVDPQKPEHRQLAIMHYLGGLQESLVKTLGGT